MQRTSVLLLVIMLVSASSCELSSGITTQSPVEYGLSLSKVASILADLPLTLDNYVEVHDAVTSSALNGYDEEYMMRDLFSSPGRGVGSSLTRSSSNYANPLRDLFDDYLSSPVKGGSTLSSEEYLTALAASDLQIYWPYSSEWDGRTAPVITFDPGDDSSYNVGYDMTTGKEILVTEELAQQRPVWIVNNNDDSGYKTLELLLRENRAEGTKCSINSLDGGDDDDFKTLMLKSMTMNRHYDGFFSGASEFWIKMGALESFTASTEAELRLYSPSITDFMVVIRRRQLGKEVPVNAVLVSEWSSQLEEMAFMVIEDDGGTQTSWKFEAVAKVQSKSYGIDISIPLNSRDDIVWRGGLSTGYLEKYQGKTQHFGGVDLVFEFI